MVLLFLQHNTTIHYSLNEKTLDKW